MGPTGSTAVLTVRGADGSPRVFRIPRIPLGTPSAGRGSPWRLLEGNVGYVDLRRLEPGELDSMFEAMGKTKAVILALRGYLGA